MDKLGHFRLHKIFHLLNVPRSTIEGNLIPGSKSSLESRLGSKAPQLPEIHDADPSAEMVSFLHCMSGQDLTK